MTQKAIERSMLGILLNENILSEVIQEQSEGHDHRVPKAEALQGQTCYRVHNVVKVGMKIATHLNANVSAYALCARFIFLTGKNMAALSKLISQMVMYLHASSHVKPQRVKMRMQMRQGRNIKTMNIVTRSLFCFCVGQELVWGETAVSLKRRKRRELSNTKSKCWLVIAGFCSWEMQW